MGDNSGSPSRTDLLAIYLNDHLAGATAGLDLARRLADAHQAGAEGEQLRSLANEVANDRAALIAIMERLGVSVDPIKALLGRIGEKLSRLKLNGYVFSRSPLSTVVELEAMLLGVRGKAAGWRTLRALAEHDERLDSAELDRLITRADDQISGLEGLRTAAVARTFISA